jgi:hypothetical protein
MSRSDKLLGHLGIFQMKVGIVFLLLLLGLPSMTEEVSPSKSQKNKKNNCLQILETGFVDSRHWLKPRPGHESPDSIALEAQTSAQRCEKVGALTNLRDCSITPGDIGFIEEKPRELIGRVGPGWVKNSVLAGLAQPIALQSL